LDKESLMIITAKIRESFKRIQRKTKRYDSSNWGFPFITAFLILLFTAAVFLATSAYFASAASSAMASDISDKSITSANFASWATKIANGAYFALVIGVLFQLGNVNSKTVRETPARIKKLKFALQYVFSGKNKKQGAAIYGSG
jgi:hypothetical protein